LAMRSSLATMPTTQFLVKERAPSARRRIDWRRFLIRTGLKTLSCEYSESKSGRGKGRERKGTQTHLELSLSASDRDGHVVSDDLSGDHRDGLALGRVDLTRHDRRSGLVLGKGELSKTATGTGTEVTDVVGDLVEGASDDVQGAGSLDDGVVGGEGFELVGRRLERETGDLGNLGGDLDVEAALGVEAL
jgi:hypothetical protein